jgi:hypothetical protein
MKRMNSRATVKIPGCTANCLSCLEQFEHFPRTKPPNFTVTDEIVVISVNILQEFLELAVKQPLTSDGEFQRFGTHILLVYDSVKDSSLASQPILVISELIFATNPDFPL